VWWLYESIASASNQREMTNQNPHRRRSFLPEKTHKSKRGLFPGGSATLQWEKVEGFPIQWKPK